MMVKVCGITNLEDALEAVAGGASALGFNFYPPSPRYIAPEAAARIVERLPAGILNVGVFVNESPEAVVRILRLAGLDVAQLHGEETPEAAPRGVRLWKAFRVDPSFHPARMNAWDAEAFLLDAPAEAFYGGSGQTFDWERARGLGRRIVLAGGLDASNVRAAIQAAQPWGVDACSRLESSPGRKDRHKMKEFLKAALT
ncbi:MAG: phosphoribosylanthranilate isomerase [Acidobacteria bacterium]|nr:phosphoribosylanthranilate isomerase [Acidobacteriota bacterium]